MARHYQPRRRAPARPSPFAVALYYVTNVAMILIVGVALYLAWPMLMARVASAPPATSPAPFSAPIARPAVQSDRSAPEAAPLALPTASLAQIEATSTAIYHATAAAVDAPPPNTNATGDSAPLVIEEKLSVRAPAGANAPTAEPIALPQSDEQTGSKAVLINPQETHACRHGQVWTDSGCKNPTPVQP